MTGTAGAAGPVRALLVGIPEYDSEAITNLPFVEQDIARLAESCQLAGYETTTLGVRNSPRATRGSILASVHGLCRTARRGETIFISFSGHGLHYNGKDYLVPADASIADDIIEELLVPLDFAKSVEISQAKSIFFVIDACREGVELGTMSTLALQRWSEGQIEYVAERLVAFVFSCTAGEVSRFVNTPNDQFSLFSRSLSDVLKPRAISLSFGSFRTELQTNLDQLASDFGLPRQTIRVKSEDSAATAKIDSLILVAAQTEEASPEVNPSESDDFVVEKTDEALLEYLRERPSGWYVHVLDFLRASEKLNLSIGRIAWRFQKLQKVAAIDIPDLNLPVLEDVAVTAADMRALLDVQWRESGAADPLSNIKLLIAAGRLQEQVLEARHRLQRFEALGVTV